MRTPCISGVLEVEHGSQTPSALTVGCQIAFVPPLARSEVSVISVTYLSFASSFSVDDVLEGIVHDRHLNHCRSGVFSLKIIITSHTILN